MGVGCRMHWGGAEVETYEKLIATFQTTSKPRTGAFPCIYTRVQPCICWPSVKGPDFLPALSHTNTASSWRNGNIICSFLLEGVGCGR